MTNIEYKVGPLRAAGLEAKWGRTRNGAPIILARWPDGREHQRNTWWCVDQSVWSSIKRDGVIKGFDNATLLGDVFFN